MTGSESSGTEPLTYESIARKWIEGTTGLFAMESREMVVWHVEPREVQVATFVLQCVTSPANRHILDLLVEQSDLRAEQQ